MTGRILSRCLEVSRFESGRSQIGNENESTTAAETTGPASGPRPASSIPAILSQPFSMAFFSNVHRSCSTASASGDSFFATFVITGYLEIKERLSWVSLKKWALAMKPLQNPTFCPISASGSNFNPRNAQCIPVVKIIAFLDLEQKSIFFKGLTVGFGFSDVPLFSRLYPSVYANNRSLPCGHAPLKSLQFYR